MDQENALILLEILRFINHQPPSIADSLTKTAQSDIIVMSYNQGLVDFRFALSKRYVNPTSNRQYDMRKTENMPLSPGTTAKMN